MDQPVKKIQSGKMIQLAKVGLNWNSLITWNGPPSENSPTSTSKLSNWLKLPYWLTRFN